MLLCWTLVPRAHLHHTNIFPDILSRVAGLHLILDDVAQNLSGRHLSEKQRSELPNLKEGAQSILDELGLVLEGFSGLGKEQLTISAKTRKAWKKLRWDQDAIREFRSRITLNTTMLTAFNFSLTSQSSQTMVEGLATVHEQVSDLQSDNDQRERLELLDWITPLNFPAQHSALLCRRQEGTGQWLFKLPEFKTWMNKPGETLLCRGIPGAGKTMLASIAIDHLQSTLRHKNIPVIYIYCDYKRQQEQTLINLMASILKQLLQHRTLVPDGVMSSYHQHVNSGTRLNFEETGEIIKNLLAEFLQAYIVVDALDELPVSSQVCQILLTYLRALQKVQCLNLMTTSRPIPQIEHQLQDSLSLEIRASSQDIKRYVYGRMSDLAMSARKDPRLQEAMAQCIVDIVDGMFLLARLHMDSLTDKTSPKAIKRALEKLPMGSDALDLAYDQAMQRIQDQKPGFRTLAERALSWITYTYRLLTVKELCYALAIEVGETEFDEDNLDDIESILLVCCGLVIVEPETETVRLAHYTTQDYFKKFGSRHFPSAREDIAVICLTHLHFGEIGEGWIPCDTATIGGGDPKDVVAEIRLNKYPFLLYAAQFWARHAEDCSTSFDDRVGKLLIDFITDDKKVSSAAQVSIQSALEFELYCETASSTPISGIHLAAYANFAEMMSFLLEAALSAADVKDQIGRTPLMWAAQQGHEAVVKMLLHRQDVEVNTVESRPGVWHPRTALGWAAYYGHAGTVKLLLERNDIDVNFVDHKDKITPLQYAAMRRHEAALKALLKHEDILADYDASTLTALHWAAVWGCAGSVQLLLERDDVDADRRNASGMTPLAIAAYYGELDVVKLLLRCKDVDVNSRDDDGQTVLQWASRGAKVDAKALRRQDTLELIRSAVEARSRTTQEQPPLGA